MITDIVNHLKDMLELPDEEIPEFIDTFLVSLDDCCEQLKTEMENPDFSAIRIITHTLSGFTANMGAEDLLAAAKELNAAQKYLTQNSAGRESPRFWRSARSITGRPAGNVLHFPEKSGGRNSAGTFARTHGTGNRENAGVQRGPRRCPGRRLRAWRRGSDSGRRTLQ